MSTTAVRDRPILMSGPMVKAILDGRKTMTRRVIKPQPRWDREMWDYDGRVFNDDEMAEHLFHEVYGTTGTPYGSLYQNYGDRIWVRETWQQIVWEGRGQCRTIDVPTEGRGELIYAASIGNGEEPPRWRPSIHMPRWASRLTLEITEIRVERLQAISAKDIIAEGVVLRAHDDQFGHNPVSAFDGGVYMDLLSLWAAGWDKINGKRAGCTWKDNPWCWVIGFKKVTP